MKSILAQVQNPEWWFTVVVVGMIISVISAYAKDWLSAGLASVSTRYRRYAFKRLRQNARLVSDLRSTPHLLVIEYVRTLFGLGASLGLLSFSFFLPAWNVLMNSFPEVDFTVSIFGMPPTTSRLSNSIASLVAMVGGMFYWARFLGKLSLCEKARRQIRDALRPGRGPAGQATAPADPTMSRSGKINGDKD